MYKTINRQQVQASLYSFKDKEDKDLELSAVIKKAFSLGFHASDVLSVFNLVLGRRVSDTQYITGLCPRCRSIDTFMISVLPDDIVYSCRACSCQKTSGDGLVELINLYNEGLTRRNVINAIKQLMRSREQKHSLYNIRKQMEKKYQREHGVKVIAKKDKAKT